MSTLTIFTPTFNRANYLINGYNALCRQTCKDFEWLIIDDGSTDNTKELVDKWIGANHDFTIKYVYKSNGGLYTTYNTAIELIQTELCVCVDSDDYLVDDAVEKIIDFWRKNGSEKYAGIVGLDCFKNGDIVGDRLPNQKSINLIDLLFGKYNLKNGDRKDIVRTDLYKAVAPMEEFPGERDFNPHYLHIKISQRYDFLVLNEKLCVIEYLPDGMTNTIIKQYYRSPKSFKKMRILDMSLKGAPLLFIIKKTLHYIASCILAKERCVKDSPRKMMTIALYPFGWLLSIYIKVKAK